MKDTLVKYQAELKSRLDSPVPPKHTKHPDAFKLFLKRELEGVTAKIEAAKLDGAKK